MVRRFFLIAYDVSDDRRRVRLEKLLAGYASRTQFSVFEAWLAAGEVDELLGRAEAHVKAPSDSLRLYPVCRECLDGVRVLGRGGPPDEEELVVV